jgi:glucose-6-phosphate 1-dehydrogenase
VSSATIASSQTKASPVPAAKPTGAAMVPAFDLVIVGGGGDLSRRKLLPAMFQRDKEGVITPESTIWCLGRSVMTDEEFRKAASEFLKGEEQSAIDAFLKRVRYVSADSTNAESMGKALGSLKDSSRTRAFYLATAPDLFAKVCAAIKGAELATPETRVVLEKPIGTDLDSARAITNAVAQHFSERQTYRIDHYLGKETVQNLMVLRFGNAIFEHLWTSSNIDHVQITAAESVGLEGRAGYYDGSGAMRDMVQNHVLQLLCLIAMEPPNTLDADAIHDEKVRVLKALRPIAGTDVLERTVRGQYSSGVVEGKDGGPVSASGYAEELGRVSDTETYVAVKAEINNWRWAGVPFYLRTGKRMPKRASEIVIVFKRPPHDVFAASRFRARIEPNRLVISLQPDDGIELVTNSKIPGSGPLRIAQTSLDLKFHSTFDNRSPEAYERLLTDVIRGDQTLFMRRDEVEAAWSYIDPITQAWARHDPTPHKYPAGSWGPTRAIGLIERDGRSWIDPQVAS